MKSLSGFDTGVRRNKAEITVTVILGRLSFSSCNNPERFIIAVSAVWMNKSRFLEKKVQGICQKHLLSQIPLQGREQLPDLICRWLDGNQYSLIG